jgi:hypothetical protein
LLGSSAVYAAGAVGVAATSSLWLLTALGLVLGTAWAVVYAATTMTVSTTTSAAFRKPSPRRRRGTADRRDWEQARHPARFRSNGIYGSESKRSIRRVRVN